MTRGRGDTKRALFPFAQVGGGNETYYPQPEVEGYDGYDDSVVPYKRKPVLLDEVDTLYLGSRKACRISDFTNEDTEDISRRSYNKDKKLLSDITSKLCRLEFDNVKVGKDVAKKTTFRKFLYGYDRPPLEKQTLEDRRLERLRNPWDYTNSNNYFRPPKRQPKTKQEKEEAKQKERNRPLWLKSERIEPEKLKDPYPRFDPLGLYRPREKPEPRNPNPVDTLSASKYQDMNLNEMLANVRAKVESMPRRRAAQADTDAIIEELTSKPLPRSDTIEYKVIDSDEVDPDWQPITDPGLDDRMKRKLKDSRFELEQFERMLDQRFGRKALRAPSMVEYNPYIEMVPIRAPTKVPPPVDMELGMRELKRELGVYDDYPDYPVPVPVVGQASREPAMVRARTSVRPRRRTGSLPPPDRVGRARLATDIEVDIE